MRDRFEHPIPTDAPLITGNYQVLHFDEEPVLFTGTNKYGNRVIGSLVDDDDGLEVSLYFHVIVDWRRYNDFLKRRVSYVDILRESSPIYIVEKTYDGSKTEIYYATFDEIPLDNRPTEESFCPMQTIKPTFSYSMRLKGALADTNMAVPRVIGGLQTTFAELLESISKSLKNIVDEPPVVLQSAYSPGSFALNFEMPITFGNMFIKDEEVFQYLNDFLEYCVEHLPDEVAPIYEKDFHATPFFSNLLKRFTQLYSGTGISIPEKYEDSVLDQVRKSSESIAELADVIGDHFTSIEIANNIEMPHPIAYLDADFRETINAVVDAIQTKVQAVNEDDKAHEYEIFIYHLNKESRSGNAIIFTEGEGPDRIICRPKIRILGDQPLEETKYTESLYYDRPITVLAKAKRVDGRYRFLEIEFEEK